jgi:hypothetical protein
VRRGRCSTIEMASIGRNKDGSQTCFRCGLTVGAMSGGFLQHEEYCLRKASGNPNKLPLMPAKETA